MAKVDGLDGLCNIQDRHILCLTQALDFYAKNNLADLALSKNWSKSDMLQAVAQPLHNISNEYKRSFAFSIPTQKAKTKNGKDASPAIATYTVTMGLSLDEKNNFSLTKTGHCILNHDLSIPSYALTLLSKVGIYNTNNERVTNLLTLFCKYAKDNPNASYTKDDIKSKVLEGIGPENYFDSREDIAFNAFLVSGFLSVSNDEKYIVHNDDYNLISFLATNGDNITPPNDEEESYMGDINKGIVELITEENQYLFYPKYNDLINIKFGKYNTSLTKHNNFSNGPLQQIYYGAPGTGKSHKIDEQTNDDNSIRTTFHPDTDYATFVGAYKPMMDTVEEYALDATGKTHKIDYPNEKSSIIYKYEPQVFLKAYVEAWKRYLNKQEGEDDSYYLVIEEINRGNCAQIFGDLFQLLDREDSGYSSYAISPESAITKYLAEDALSADGTKFSDLEFSDVTKKRKDVEKIIATADDLKAGKLLVMPPNLHIWATMNTSDQSLFPIDSAFKRRWDWEYMPIKRADTKPENKWTIRVTHDGKTYWCYWWEFLEAINHQIEETTHSEDKQLGYFFAKPTAGKNFISTDTFVNKVIFYLWNDVFKDEDSAVFQYDNDQVEDVSIGRSGAMYFRHFMEKKDEMIHYFINQLFAMGKDNNPVVPIDYLKYDNNPKVIEHLPMMREDTEEAPEAEENDDADGKAKRNTDKYIVDGAEEQIYKKQLLEKIVRKQLEKNPNITNEKLKEDWKDISLNSQPCILNDEEYQELISNKTSYEGRYNQLEGRGIWVNNQIGGAENASKIIKKAQSLGITVEIVGK